MSSRAPTAPMLAATRPITRPKTLPANSEKDAISWMIPRKIVIHPHVWRLEKTNCVSLTQKLESPTAAMPDGQGCSRGEAAVAQDLRGGGHAGGRGGRARLNRARNHRLGGIRVAGHFREWAVRESNPEPWA